MSTRKKKDVRAAAQVTEEIEEKSEEKKAPESTDVPTTAGAGSNLWVVVMLIVPLSLCLLWGALTR